MAGDVEAAQLLIGMRVEALSKTPAYVPRVKQSICRHCLEDVRELACNPVTLATAGEVKRMLERFLEDSAN